MGIKKVFYLSIIGLLIHSFSTAQEVLQWRGDQRSGVYHEKNLLKVWPETGPDLLWEFPELGAGYGSPAITTKNIFINGEMDAESYLLSLDLTGKLIWKSKIGPEWVASYPGSRTTPTVVGELVYVTTGMGKVACFEAQTGKVKWSLDMVGDLHGRNTRFGFSESVLVDGNSVFCCPGSPDTNVVALDRITGKIKWICKALGQLPAYCSPLLIKLPARIILLTFTRNALLAIDTKDGKLLWTHEQQGDGDVHVNTPLFDNGFIYYIAGNGNGTVKLQLSEDGAGITEIWKNQDCDGLMGGFIKMDDFIYASGYVNRVWYSLDANTGSIVDTLAFNTGSTIFADGLLYLYNEKGQLGLCKPNGPKLEIINSFKIIKGTKAHFAHPVICNGILYLRRGNSLLAYDIKNKS